MQLTTSLQEQRLGEFHVNLKEAGQGEKTPLEDDDKPSLKEGWRGFLAWQE